MTRVPVSSRSIRSVGHEGSVLEVEFHNGGVYRYEGVTAEQAEALRQARSIGQHFQRHIRGGGFRSHKVTR